jgi:hypothetical protein
MTVICKVCGTSATLPQGKTTGFCGACGAAVEADLNVPAPAQSKRKKRLKPLIILSAVVVVLAAGTLTALVATGILPISLGNGTYETAEANFFKSLASGYAEGKGYKIDFTAEAAEQMAEQLGFDGLSYSGSISVKGLQFLADVTSVIDDMDVRIVSAFDGQELSLAVPDATDYYYRASVNTDDDDYGVTLDGKALTNIVKEYLKLAKGLVEVEKGVELSGGGVTVKCDQYTIDFTAEDLASVVYAAIDEVRGNDDLADYIDGFLESRGNSYLTSERLDDLEAEFEYFADRYGDKRLFRMTVWVKNNTVIARKIDKVYEASYVTLSYQFLNDGKNASFEAVAKLDGDDMNYKLSGDFTKKGGAWSGDVKFKYKEWQDGDYKDNTLKLSVEDAKLDGKILSGKFAFSGVIGNEYKPTIAVVFGKSGNAQTITLEAELGYTDYAIDRGWYGQGEIQDYGKSTLSYTLSEINGVSTPTYDEANGVNIEWGRRAAPYPGETYTPSENERRESALTDDLYSYFVDKSFWYYAETNPAALFFTALSQILTY